MECAFDIIVPESVEVVHFKNKFRLVGTKEDISKLSEEIRKISKLNDGQLCKLDKYTLKLSEVITKDANKPNWVELPSHCWNIMASLFQGVVCEHEGNPFDFNSVGYTNPIPFDIGVEITDLPYREF